MQTLALGRIPLQRQDGRKLQAGTGCSFLLAAVAFKLPCEMILCFSVAKWLCPEPGQDKPVCHVKHHPP